MNSKYRVITFILLLTLLFLPTGNAYAQGPGPGDGRVVFGSNVTIESGDPFEGDLVVIGGNVTIEKDAVMNGDLVVVGGRVESDGEVNGDVVNVGGQLILNETAFVSGDVVTVGGQIKREGGAQIDGDVVNNVFPQIDISNGNVPPVVVDVPDVPNVPGILDVQNIVTVRSNPFFEFGWVFIASLLAAGIGVLVLLFFDERLDRVSHAAISQPVMAGSLGLLSVFVGFLLFWMIVPLLALAFAWLFGIVALGQEIGTRFAKASSQDWAPVIATGLGTFTLMFIIAGSFQALDNIPWFLGCFIWVLPVLVGLLAIGAVVITRFGAIQATGPGMNVLTPPVDAGQAPPASDA